jgi:hypothetical protein
MSPTSSSYLFMASISIFFYLIVKLRARSLVSTLLPLIFSCRVPHYIYLHRRPAMATSKKRYPSKKGARKQQLSPLPSKPTFLFVVGNHPADFRVRTVMKQVRAHVMNKAVELRDSSLGAKLNTTIMRSPRAKNSDGVRGKNSVSVSKPAELQSARWDGQFNKFVTLPSPIDQRDLAARIIIAITATTVQSAPQSFTAAREDSPLHRSRPHQELLEDLKQQYIESTDCFYRGMKLGSCK